jgi:hypothetical protein
LFYPSSLVSVAGILAGEANQDRSDPLLYKPRPTFILYASSLYSSVQSWCKHHHDNPSNMIIQGASDFCSLLAPGKLGPQLREKGKSTLPVILPYFCLDGTFKIARTYLKIGLWIKHMERIENCSYERCPQNSWPCLILRGKLCVTAQARWLSIQKLIVRPNDTCFSNSWVDLTS